MAEAERLVAEGVEARLAAADAGAAAEAEADRRALLDGRRRSQRHAVKIGEIRRRYGPGSASSH